MTALHTLATPGDWSSIGTAPHPLRACGCGTAHDQSASCASVAAALKLNQRRDRLIARICRKDEA